MKDAIYIVNPETKELVTPYEELPKAKRIVAAQPFTVSMVATVVAEDLDGFLRGKNDILVLSRSAMGDQPQVERIHAFEEEVPKGRPIKNILADCMFLADDYNGLDKLWLEVHVLEIDTDTGERKAAVTAFQSLAALAGGIFPAIMPYAFGASAVVGLIDKLMSILEKDTHVVRVPFAMYPDAPRPGRAPFQAGTYVTFATPQEPAGFKLQSNGLLTTGNKPSEVSYAIFDVAPAKQVSPKYVASQKVATLLTQMQKGNSNSPLATVDFLTATLTQYSNFGKLTRYLELKSKDEPSAEEKALMAEIGKLEVLKPFLPAK